MAFESINVLSDPDAALDLKRFGAKRIPVVSRGERWVYGQLLDQVARFVGVAWQAEMLSADVLISRVNKILAAAASDALQLPDRSLNASLPMLQNRERAYSALAYHVGQVVECYLNLVEKGKPLASEDLAQAPPPGMGDKSVLLGFLAEIQRRFRAWQTTRGAVLDYGAPADVYYGGQSLHGFLERTAWHAAHHTRQLEQALAQLGVTVKLSLTDEDLDGLPLPQVVFDE